MIKKISVTLIILVLVSLILVGSYFDYKNSQGIFSSGRTDNPALIWEHNGAEVWRGDHSGVFNATTFNASDYVESTNITARDIGMFNGVGIGTASPVSPLTIEGASGTLITLNNSQNSGNYISAINDLDKEIIALRQNTAGDSLILLFNSTGDEKIKIHTNGNSYILNNNFGIGTASPSSKLSIVDNSNSQLISPLAVKNIINNTNGTSITFLAVKPTSAETEANLRFAGWIRAWFDGGGNDDAYISIQGPAAADAAPFDILTVSADDGGRVGIGTASPGTKLHIDGGATTTIAKLETDDGYDIGVTGFQGATQKLGLAYDDSRDVVSLAYGSLQEK